MFLIKTHFFIFYKIHNHYNLVTQILMEKMKISLLKTIKKNKNIANLWMGQTISQIGDSMYEIGLLWIVLELTGSKTITGLIAMSSYLPTMIFGLFAGALTDHFDRRRIMLFADLVRALLAAIIPVVAFAFSLNSLFLGIITFFIAGLNTLFNPARDAIIPQLVEKDRLFQANSLMQSTWQLALFAGPALAGIVLAIIGPVHLFSFDAATFFISFLFIYSLPASRKRNKGPRREIMEGVALSYKNVKEGLRYIVKNQTILILLFFTAIDNLFIMGPAIVGLPIFVKEILNAPASVYALAQTAMAGGMLVGTLMLNAAAGKFKHSRILILGIILDGLTYFPMYWVQSDVALWAVLFIHGLVIPMIIIPRPTIIHLIAPKEFHGRIFAMVGVSVTGLTAISVALTGIIAEFVSIKLIFAWIAIFASITGALGSLSKEFRKTV